MKKVELPHWERPHWKPGGGMPQLFFKLHGDFSQPPKISRSKYRTEGPPEDVEMVTFDADDDADAFGFGLDDVFAARLRRAHPKVYAAVAKAPQALIVRGDLDDPDSLDYLRDTVGLIMAMLDTGGAVAVFDPFRLDWWTPDEWRTRLFIESGRMPKEEIGSIVPKGFRWEYRPSNGYSVTVIDFPGPLHQNP
jgi:hypothetical protein